MAIRLWCVDAAGEVTVCGRYWESFFKFRPMQLPILIVFSSMLFFASLITHLGKHYYSETIGGKATSALRPPSLDCMKWNHTQKCPITQATEWQPDPTTRPEICPEYFRWIHEDLRHWKSTGITEEMVEEARQTAHFRLTISEGRMYVEKFKDTFQTRGLYTLWGFAQLMTRFAGRLPDLELMFNCNDTPVVVADQYAAAGSVPPPLFKYCADNRTLDIVFPDWSFWGWAEVNIKPWGMLVKEMKEKNEKLKWEERVPYAYWKGNPFVSPQRHQLMHCNPTPQMDWNARIYTIDWTAETRNGFKESNLANQCTHRYKIYAEGKTWSVSEKYILACNSPVLLIQSRWYDFFSRGLVPRHHYWPLRNGENCKSIKFAVEWGNNHSTEAKEIGEGGSRFAYEALKMENVYDYMFHLLHEYAKLLKYKPKIPPNAVQLCSEALACPAHVRHHRLMEESLEKLPTHSLPCKMPPPFQPADLLASAQSNMEVVKQVEAWEEEYWAKIDTNVPP